MTKSARHSATDDADFIARISDAYTPEPMAPARRAAFDARLRERLTAPRLPRLALPASAAAFGVALLALAVFRGSPPRTSAANLAAVEAVESVAAFEAVDWEYELFYADAMLERDREAALPEEFVEISYAFLE